jgi:hypothetical protein
MKSSGILVLVALLSALFPSAWAAETLTFQDGDGGAYSTTQATYSNWIGAVNYGTAPTMIVSVDIVVADFTPGKRFFVWFPDIIGNNEGQIPPGSIIQQASLRLWRDNSSTQPANLYMVTSTWDENTLTGENYPSFDYPGAISYVPAGAAGPNDALVNLAVQAWADGTANYGLVSTVGYSPTTFSEIFYSDDAADKAIRPLLTVTFTRTTATEQTTWGRVKALYR